MSSNTLAYLGPQGTFSEEAALRYGPNMRRVAYRSVWDAAMAAESGETDESILPIENSIEGAVNVTLDYLIHDAALSIVGEVVLAVQQCLIAAGGTRAHLIESIRSHPHALAQCRRYLERAFPNATLIPTVSTAGAVEEAMKEPGSAAAIGNRKAADLFGATVLEVGIEDNPNNMTRFVALGRNSLPRSGADKTSICFGFAEDAPGLLHGVLGEFASRAINLAKIESRPTRNELGRYVFLADLIGHHENTAVRDALGAVERRASMFRVLGSYPVDSSVARLMSPSESQTTGATP